MDYKMNIDKIQVRDDYDRTKKGFIKGPKKARLYVSISNENILDNLQNRHSRPYNQYKKLFPQIFAQLKEQGIEIPQDAKLNWSQYCGCSCPCSPGFIIDRGLYNKVIWVDISYEEIKV